MVCTRCMTFNHDRFIQDALEGFTIQETNFPFVTVILDDASTDNNDTTILNFLKCYFNTDSNPIHEEYGTVYIANHKVNENCHFVVILLNENHYSQKKPKYQYIEKWVKKSKYQAICEGDDYWTDKFKLQKQVDILENNNEIMMVYTNYETVDENGNRIFRERYENYYKKLSASGDILPNLFISNFPLTFTSLFRKEVFNSDNYLNAPNRIDYSLFLSAASMGDCYYMKEKTGCYRNNSQSLMNTQQDALKPLLRSAYHYHACLYAKGKCKKRSFHKDYKIKFNICQNLQPDKYYGSRDVMREILSINKSFYFPFFHVFLINVLRKIKRKAKAVFSK